MSTGELAVGTALSSRQYLAEVAAASTSTRAFVATLNGLAPTVTPASARAAAAQLHAQAAATDMVYRHLSAGRVGDDRLDGQRTRVLPRLAALATVMNDIADLAAQGKDVQLVALLPTMRQAAAKLRSAGG
ncbi:MAG: hypothetical protein U0Y82_02005 [Thermoleophilia bacterium]